MASPTLPSIFHDGDLNSGISQAITQNKLVACFVAQEGEYWSRIWEEYWLQNLDSQWDEESGPPLAQLLYDKAVLLKIEAGSKEAEFLNAFCPIKTVPTFVMIHNGKVLEKAEAGVEREDFVVRISRAAGIPVEAGAERREKERREAAEAREQEVPPPVVTKEETAQQRETERSTAQHRTNSESASGPSSAGAPRSMETSTQQPPARAIPATSTPSHQAPAPSTQQHDVPALLAERAARLEEARQKREAAEKADRIARLRAEAEEAHRLHKGKQPADQNQPLNDKAKSRADWIQQQKQRKDEAKRERVRILERIEADKAERKLRAQREKENAAQDPNAELSFAPESALRPAGRNSPGAAAAPIASLQVRLFDGTSIRSRFEPDTATLASTVRAWIKESATPESGTADGSYTFRLVLPLQPAHHITATEEQQTLRELGFAPHASLVLFPVEKKPEGYWTAGIKGALSKIFDAIYAFIAAIVLLIGGVLGLTGSPGAEVRAGQDGAAAASGTRAVWGEPAGGASSGVEDGGQARFRVKTLADQRAEAEGKKDQTEFYNGNSSAFQGRGEKNTGGEDEDSAKDK